MKGRGQWWKFIQKQTLGIEEHGCGEFILKSGNNRNISVECKKNTGGRYDDLTEDQQCTV